MYDLDDKHSSKKYALWKSKAKETLMKKQNKTRSCLK